MMTSIACHEVVQGGFTAKDKVSELKDVQIFELGACIKDLYSLGKGNNWISSIKVVMSGWFELDFIAEPFSKGIGLSYRKLATQVKLLSR